MTTLPKIPGVLYPENVGLKVSRETKANIKLAKAHGYDTPQILRDAVNEAVLKVIKEIESKAS